MKRALLLALAAWVAASEVTAQTVGLAPSLDRLEFEKVHERLAPALRDSAFGLPLVVEASVEDERVRGDVYSVLDHSFEVVSSSLQSADAWCDMLTLHFNVKSCQRGGAEVPGRVSLRIATARKYYVPPQGRNPRTYWLDTTGSRPDLLRSALTTDRGPFGVRDMRIEIFGMAVDADRTFVHLRYAYAPGWLARAATSTFLATVGRRKIGFTVTGTDASGEPVYVRGSRGAVERNALRYHMAMVAYLDTQRDRGGAHGVDAFERRIARWFDLTERYPAQLREMSRDEYLDMKRREHRDQQSLQAVPASRVP